MKTILKISFALFLLLSFNACNKLKDALTAEVPIPENSVDFQIGPAGQINAGAPRAAKAPAAATAEVTLFDKVLNVNVASELQKQGMTVDQIKSFTLVQTSLTIQVPDGYADYTALLNSFKTVKLYFDNTTQLVAEGKSVTISGRKGVVEITVKNPELLDKLKNDQLHVILTGEKFPPVVVNAVLKTTYKAKIRVIK